MKEKKFDAVKMMREIRDKLHDKYKKDPMQKQKDLDQIRKKYSHLSKKEKVS
jgi:uncharacterized protein YbbC (DUF1343 family)